MKFTTRILALAAVIGAVKASTGVEERISPSPSGGTSDAPSDVPSYAPTLPAMDTFAPTVIDTLSPTPIDTVPPTPIDSLAEDTDAPTLTPTAASPTISPTIQPATAAPTVLTVTDAPTLQPTTTATTASCDASTETLQTCFVNELNGGSSCDSCVATVLQDLNITSGSLSCEDYESQVCAAISTCSCGTCIDELQDFLDCSIGSAIGCSLNCLQPTVAPTSATVTDQPTSVPAEETIAPTVAPTVAATTVLPTATPTLIPTVAATDAPTLAATPEPGCDGSTDTLQTCFANNLNGGSECDQCVATILQNIGAVGRNGDVSCDDYETEVCEALSDCPCEGCLPDLQDFLNCNIGPAVGCTLSCLSPTSAPAPSASTSVPTIAAATPAPTSCSDSTETLQTCFADELGGSTECDMCVATILQDIGAVGSNPFNQTCSDYDSQVCAAISACPCGTCLDDVQTFINCNVAPNIGCSLTCSDEQPATNATCPVTQDDITTCFAAEVFESTCGSCLQDLAGNLSATAGINANDLIAGGMANLSDVLGGSFGDFGEDFNCSFYQDSMCQVVSTCDCGTCFDDVATFLDCNIGAATGCFLNCDDGETVAPSAASVTEAPVAAPSCAQIEEEAITCLANAGDMGQECDRYV
ncbi:hypothetical protein MPSEU_000779900 [Mayamaea pseudoterrestris]|nr:hypothetical protein MPSEU_000779900 [Mayamaea pseudoterrestris]